MRFESAKQALRIGTARATMPNSYSEDLRWRAIWLHTVRATSYSEIADVLCNIALATSEGCVPSAVH